MKLADSWVDDEPNLVSPTAFHDEVEEHDEVDEGKDGCGGVRWQAYVLIKPQTSNKQLHELAREIRGVEKRRGRRLAVVQYEAISENGRLPRCGFCDQATIISPIF